MNKEFNLRAGFVVWSVVLFLITGTSGCVEWRENRPLTGENEPDVPTGSRPEKNHATDADLKSWKEGTTAFQSGQYEKARGIFENLRKCAGSEDLRTMALYGLACTGLASAQNAPDYATALDLLNRWSRLSPTQTYGEDPRMIIPSLQHLAPSAQSDIQSGSSPARITDSSRSSSESSCSGQTPAQQPPSQDNTAKRITKEVVKIIKDKECEGVVRTKEKEIQSLRRQIWVLRHQMEALETIHRDIQQKKELVSPP